MPLTLNIKGKEIELYEYYGWSEPGRIPEIDWKNKKNKEDPPFTRQLLEISEFIESVEKSGGNFTSKGLQNATSYSPSAWRQIRPIMYKLGLLTTKISENKKIKTKEPISKKGKVYNKVTKSRLENDSNYKELIDVQRNLWGIIIMSYQMNKPEGLYPIRAIIKTLNRNQYLAKTNEWDIMTTFITKNDDVDQELIVDSFIKEYRTNPVTFVDIEKVKGIKKGPKKGRLANTVNYNTYKKNLFESGLITFSDETINGKKTEVIKLNTKNKLMIDLILSEDFYNEEKNLGFLDYFRFKSDNYYEEISKDQYQALIESYVEYDSLDMERMVKARKEQLFLRQSLFRDKKTELCGICRREFPVELLITAHIKKRARCTIVEKLDYKNVVMPMCTLGCDYLYEKGYIGVKNGTIELMKNKNDLTPALQEYIGILSGEKCNYWCEASRNYFDWHITYHDR
jgi:hypothetical protein